MPLLISILHLGNL